MATSTTSTGSGSNTAAAVETLLVPIEWNKWNADFYPSSSFSKYSDGFPSYILKTGDLLIFYRRTYSLGFVRTGSEVCGIGVVLCFPTLEPRGRHVVKYVAEYYFQRPARKLLNNVTYRHVAEGIRVCLLDERLIDCAKNNEFVGARCSLIGFYGKRYAGQNIVYDKQQMTTAAAWNASFEVRAFNLQTMTKTRAYRKKLAELQITEEHRSLWFALDCLQMLGIFPVVDLKKFATFKQVLSETSAFDSDDHSQLADSVINCPDGSPTRVSRLIYIISNNDDDSDDK